MHATMNRDQKRTCSNQFSPLSREFGDQAQTIGSSGQLVLDSAFTQEKTRHSEIRGFVWIH